MTERDPLFATRHGGDPSGDGRRPVILVIDSAEGRAGALARIAAEFPEVEVVSVMVDEAGFPPRSPDPFRWFGSMLPGFAPRLLAEPAGQVPPMSADAIAALEASIPSRRVRESWVTFDERDKRPGPFKGLGARITSARKRR